MYTRFSVHTVPFTDTHTLHTCPFSDINVGWCTLLASCRLFASSNSMYTSSMTDTFCFMHNCPSIDTRCLIHTRLLTCIRCTMRTHPLMGTHCSVHSRCLLHTCNLTGTCSFRHPHLSLCTRPLMDTLLIVPLLWLTHFIQATFAWEVSLHESKLLSLTHFFRAALVWYSILAPQYTTYTLVSYNFVTVALLYLLFCSIQLACVVWGICTSSSFHVLCILHALCYVFHLSSLLSSMGSFAPHCHTCPFMPCIHCLDFSHSALPISWGIFASPFFHFLCISYAICCTFPLSFSFPLFFLEHLHTLLSSHSMPCILCALCCTSCHSSFLLFWATIFSHHMHFMWLPP